MEDSSQKMKEGKSSDLVDVPDNSSEQLKENLEKKIQKQNVDANLKNIKSEYTIKILFFHLDEKIKLKLIKYDKNLQNIIDINLNNYKFFFSGRYIRYIEFEADGKGKEYYGYNDELKFEGEYSNGERNGKGKEYYLNGELEFEGEYLNGKKWNGKVKEYDFYDKLIFEGEFLFDDKWNGKGYDEKGNIIYEIINSTGKRKDYYESGELYFEGEYLNGERNGKGKEYYENGKIKFEGEYLNDKTNGKGKKYYKNGKIKFEGEYLNNEKWNGKIKEYH